MFEPALDAFTSHFTAGRTQVIYTRLIADTETPVSVFMKLGGDRRESILLESVEGGEVLGRYSAIGLDPDLAWSCQDGHARMGGATLDGPADKPLETLKALIASSRIDVIDPQLPPMTSSGLFGYMAYDMIRLVENIPCKNSDPLGIPDSILMRPRLMVVFDNIKHMVYLAAPVREHAKNSVRTAAEVYAEAQNRISEARDLIITTPMSACGLGGASKLDPDAIALRSNFTRETYGDAVEKAKHYIVEGDIFQVVPSQRFEMDYDLPAFNLYRSLRRLNPSPFLFFVNFGGFSLVGSSPEIMVRVRDRVMTIRPIAGTRKRGKDKAEDEALRADLLADPKERAEHLMLLDLGRNDVGRVCKLGSVKVTDSYMVEMYSHVMHIVSNVEGILNDDMDGLDALFAGFPAGTVSGAPKIRAMEIIDELEPVQRKFYAGCVGYLDGNGDVDTCIALRTALVKDGKIHIQAGGGVVADSTAEGEYQETVNKSRAIMAAAAESIRLSQ